MKSNDPPPELVHFTRQKASVIAPAVLFISAPTPVNWVCVILVDSLDQLEGALSTITSNVPLAAVTWSALYTDSVAPTAPMEAFVADSEEVV